MRVLEGMIMLPSESIVTPVRVVVPVSVVVTDVLQVSIIVLLYEIEYHYQVIF